MLIILTGAIESGKTAVCRQLLQSSQKELTWGGVLTVDHQRDRYIRNVATGEEVLLARRLHDEMKVAKSRYQFQQSGFDFGNRVLSTCIDVPCLLCDELGSLELKGEGLDAIFQILKKRNQLINVFVIRKKYLEKIQKRLNSTGQVFEVTLKNRDALPEDIFNWIKESLDSATIH